MSVNFLKKYFEQYLSFREQPLTLEVVKSALEIVDIPELHDRLITGTAKLLGVELITNDPKNNNRNLHYIFSGVFWKLKNYFFSYFFYCNIINR